MSALSPPQAAVRLLLAHVGSLDMKMIRLTLDRLARDEAVVVDDASEADIFVVDLDRPGAEVAIAQAGARRCQVVSYSFRPDAHAERLPGSRVLGKPLHADSFIATLRRLGTALRASASRVTRAPREESALGSQMPAEAERDVCGTADDLPAQPGRIAPPASVFFDPAHYLLGHLHAATRTAIEQRRPSRITGLPGVLDIVPGTMPTVWTSVRDPHLRPLSMVQIPRDSAIGIAPFDPAARRDGQFTLSAESLLWKTALWACRGRLPVGTDPWQPVRMVGWPDFTRTFSTPHAYRLVALWTRDTLSPVEIARHLGIPQRYAFAVYSAALHAGLFDTTIVQPVLAPLPASGRVSMLSRILRKLRHAD
ncbi:hypothetical protein [Derxia gummosa]|uniref:Uncharacterized protein n=1 Tax=Derxia gummosa DSM 723 TaxID=1121388 RepID=A0A8B6X7D8_9BURK|nr:hypothetical protein [Derxia gummosa]